jgi:hypothetical protein
MNDKTCTLTLLAWFVALNIFAVAMQIDDHDTAATIAVVLIQVVILTASFGLYGEMRLARLVSVPKQIIAPRVFRIAGRKIVVSVLLDDATWQHFMTAALLCFVAGPQITIGFGCAKQWFEKRQNRRGLNLADLAGFVIIAGIWMTFDLFWLFK